MEEDIKKIMEENNEKIIKPNVCSNYSIDLTAHAFGQCKCGQPKSSHINVYKNEKME